LYIYSTIFIFTKTIIFFTIFTYFIMKIERLFDLPHYQLATFKLTKAVGDKMSGKWEHYSSRQFVDAINEVSLGLLALGVQPGDKIALISTNNRAEWNIIDLGMQQVGAINVPVYPTIAPKDYEYIFAEAEVKFCFVSDAALLKKVQEAKKGLPALQEIFTFNKVEGARHWHEMTKQGDLSEVERIKATIKAGDLATIIYTSGTTGNPKGVMLSHNNIMSNLHAITGILPLNPGEQVLSFLPLCHIFERTYTYLCMYKGITITYAESIEQISANIAEVRPHFFTAVPRLLEKVYEKIMAGAAANTGVKKTLADWAFKLADKYEYDTEMGIQQKIADKLVYSKVREKLGGNLKGMFTGSAACPPKIIRFFCGVGIKVREGYGLTETSPGVTVNMYDPYMAMFGTVGPVLSGMEVKLADDGEILVKGPNVMMGYYKHPDKTAEVMTADGWFCTGDIGTWVKNSKGTPFLKITDRKKELLKTSGGKYVAPAPIETKMKESFFIEQMMVIGEGQKFVSALIVPSFPNLEAWAVERGIGIADRAALCAHKDVIAMIEGIVNEYNPEFAKIEQIKKIKLLSDEWTVDSNELTPTMKIKRRVITEKYKDAIAEIYE
jgi:long-chain acyl-CoA synthetase